MNTASGGAGDTRRVVLVRHAQTAENVADRFLGRSDSSATSEGLAAARQLVGAIDRLAPALVLSSPARRAIETAEAMGVTSPAIDDALRELDFGDWEGATQEEVAKRDPERFAAFDHGTIVDFPGGETVNDVAIRVLDAIDRHDVSPLLVITHATVIRIAVTAMLGLPIGDYRSRFGRPANLSWTSLESTATGWRLVRYGAAAT